MRAMKSNAHSKMCKKVYGIDLCQHGMADQNQIDTMIKLLNIRNNSKVLDLGCGTGLITKYIQEKTGCTITGIDISEIAIKLAIKASVGNSKIDFQKMNIQNIDSLPNDYDAILSIDTHYFFGNFTRKIEMYLSHLSKGGLMGLFSDEGTGKDNFDESRLKANETNIGKLLEHSGIEFTGKEFYQENRNHWNKKKKILLQLKKEFLEEGNLEIYKNRIDECINECNSKGGRYFYAIKNSANRL